MCMLNNVFCKGFVCYNGHICVLWYIKISNTLISNQKLFTMKNLKRVLRNATVVVLLASMAMLQGCFGSFGLTTGLYDWNMDLGGDVAKEVVFLAFIVVPVYSVTLFLDAVVLNTIEYWSGNSPVTMEEGESETQVVMSEDGSKTYSITATKNQFHIEQIAGEGTGEFVDMVFDEVEAAWYIVDGEEKIKLAAYSKTNVGSVDYFMPTGEAVRIDYNTQNSTEAREILQAASYEYTASK